MQHGNETHIARLVFFPCWWPPPLPSGSDCVVAGGMSGSVALSARKVANMYPGPVEFPSLRVLLIT